MDPQASEPRRRKSGCSLRVEGVSRCPKLYAVELVKRIIFGVFSRLISPHSIHLVNSDSCDCSIIIIVQELLIGAHHQIPKRKPCEFVLPSTLLRA